MKQKGFAPLVIILILAILGVGGYFGYKYLYSGNKLSIPSATSSPTPSAVASQNPENFSYNCPSGWTLGENLDYGGKVKLKECSLIFASKFAFDDGGMFTLGFVPDSITQDERSYSDSQIKTLKTFANTTTYSNNGFEGFISMKNESHTLLIIARKNVTGGYYEATALGMGETKTDQEYKAIFDQMFSSFKIIQ
jgi:hypothetical protein